MAAMTATYNPALDELYQGLWDEEDITLAPSCPWEGSRPVDQVSLKDRSWFAGYSEFLRKWPERSKPTSAVAKMWARDGWRR